MWPRSVHPAYSRSTASLIPALLPILGATDTPMPFAGFTSFIWLTCTSGHSRRFAPPWSVIRYFELLTYAYAYGACVQWLSNYITNILDLQLSMQLMRIPSIVRETLRIRLRYS